MKLFFQLQTIPRQKATWLVFWYHNKVNQTYEEPENSSKNHLKLIPLTKFFYIIWLLCGTEEWVWGPQDLKQALKYYGRSANAGYLYAKKKMDQLFRKKDKPILIGYIVEGLFQNERGFLQLAIDHTDDVKGYLMANYNINIPPCAEKAKLLRAMKIAYNQVTSQKRFCNDRFFKSNK